MIWRPRPTKFKGQETEKPELLSEGGRKVMHQYVIRGKD
jgi:hypothetical protein